MAEAPRAADAAADGAAAEGAGAGPGGLLQEEDASLLGAAVRSVTKMARPLAYLAAQALVPLKHALALASHKAALALKQAMTNPVRLFRRQAVSPWEAFRDHPAGLLTGVRAVFASGGLRAVAGKAMGPYAANCAVSMAMFQTYTTMRLLLRSRLMAEGAAAERAVRCEAAAGAAAGVVQATLNAPLYNLRLQGARKRIAPGVGLLGGLRELGRRRGLRGLYQNYPFVLAQECCSLGAFFASYEWVKEHATRAVREHVDPTGEKDMYAWMAAASAAGVVLAAAGAPFENLHEWHAVRRSATTPNSVLLHFFFSARPRCRWRILLSGMRRKLPMAPVAGLPLLAYEVMVHSGLAPVLHA